MNERLKGMIGLAVKAGKTISGTFAVEGAIRRRQGKARHHRRPRLAKYNTAV